jgi:hypothetical protein
MSGAHTPGPWTLEGGRNIATQSGTFYLTYGKDKHGNALFRDFCELDANARLIASAPALLAALEELLLACKMQGMEFYGTAGYEKLVAAAKGEGK